MAAAGIRETIRSVRLAEKMLCIGQGNVIRYELSDPSDAPDISLAVFSLHGKSMALLPVISGSMVLWRMPDGLAGRYVAVLSRKGIIQARRPILFLRQR